MDNLQIYLDSVKRQPKLSEEQCQDYFREIDSHRTKLIECNLRLVVKNAFLIHEAWKNIDVMDLIQEGSIGLIQAVDRYKFSKGFTFSTFATYRIKGAIIDYIRSNTGPIKTGTTKSQRAIFYNLGEIRNELAKQGATIEDVALQFDVESQDLVDMDAQFIPIDDNDIQNELVDYRTPENVYIKNETLLNFRRKIKEFQATLPDVEQAIWENRIMEQNLTLQECCEEYFFKYPKAVQRCEQKVLGKAKDYFQSLDFRDIMEAINGSN